MRNHSRRFFPEQAHQHLQAVVVNQRTLEQPLVWKLAPDSDRAKKKKKNLLQHLLLRIWETQGFHFLPCTIFHTGLSSHTATPMLYSDTTTRVMEMRQELFINLNPLNRNQIESWYKWKFPPLISGLNPHDTGFQHSAWHADIIWSFDNSSWVCKCQRRCVFSAWSPDARHMYEHESLWPFVLLSLDKKKFVQILEQAGKIILH